jgi:hypothetical protein
MICPSFSKKKQVAEVPKPIGWPGGCGEGVGARQNMKANAFHERKEQKTRNHEQWLAGVRQRNEPLENQKRGTAPKEA